MLDRLYAPSKNNTRGLTHRLVSAHKTPRLVQRERANGEKKKKKKSKIEWLCYGRPTVRHSAFFYLFIHPYLVHSLYVSLNRQISVWGFFFASSSIGSRIWYGTSFANEQEPKSEPWILYVDEFLLGSSVAIRFGCKPTNQRFRIGEKGKGIGLREG